MPASRRDSHVIRLAGPWQYSVLSACADDRSGNIVAPAATSEGVVRMPCDWGASLGPGFRGRVRYQRVFHWTAPLPATAAVQLVFTGIDARATVSLNGQPLGDINGQNVPAWFEITDRLVATNRLIVDMECPSFATQAEELRQRGHRAGQPGGLWGEVRLEIVTRSASR